MTEVESDNEATQIAQQYVQEHFILTSPVTEEVVQNELNQWEVITYRIKMVSGANEDPYRIVVAADTGNIIEVTDIEMEKMLLA